MTPELASVAMLGITTSGLFQDTSPHPRSSTLIIRMLGAASNLATLMAMRTRGQNCVMIMAGDVSRLVSNLLLRS